MYYKESIFNFSALSVSRGIYKLTYTSPRTNKTWSMKSTDGDLYEQIKEREDLPQRELNSLKSYIKYHSRYDNIL